MVGGSCSLCGTRLYGTEVERGICENCERDGPGIRERRTQRFESSVASGEYHGNYNRPPGTFAYGTSAGLEWRYVRNGLTLLFWGLLMIPMAVAIAILSLVCGGVGRAALSSAGGEGAGIGGCVAILGLAAYALLLVAAVIVIVTANFFFIGVPRVGNLRTYAVVNGLCIGLGIVMAVVRAGAPVFMRHGEIEVAMAMGLGMAVVQLLTLVVSFVCVFAFLRGVAAYFQQQSLATQFLVWPISYLALYIGAIGILALLFGVRLFTGIGNTGGPLLPSADSEVASGLTTIGGCFLGLVSLGLYVWFLVLIHRLRATLPTVIGAGD